MRERQTGRAKYAALIFLTGVIIAALLLYKQRVNESIPVVETTTLVRTSVKDMTVCQGTVSAASGVDVYAPIPCVVGTLCVQVGDVVKAGDVLLEIDRDATVAQAVSAGVGGGQMAELASSFLAQTVTAPSDGVVSAVNAEEGEMLGVTTPCVVLSERQGVEIAVTIREGVLSKIKVGQEVMVSGVAFDKKSYHGVLTHMSQTARTRLSGTTTETVVDAVVTLNEEEIDDSLLIGLSAKAIITVDVKEDVLLVPYDCVTQTDDGETVVFVLYNGDTAVRRTVKLGKEFADGIEVLAGVEDGDIVIKAPDDFKEDAVRVTVKGAA